MIENDDRKLAANFVWLFAAVALGAAIVAPKLVHGVTTVKAMSGVFGAIFAAFGIASTLLARTGGWRAAGAFADAGVGHAVYWFMMVHSATADGGAGVAALGTGIGVILTLAFGAASIAGGIGGALFGLKIRRNLKRTQQALQRPRS
jgi:hypothetical protein